MSDQFDVVALGELLMDFTVNGESAQGNSIFEANPGGAPCNVLAMLRKLHKTYAFIGKVGDDMFGRVLRKVGEQADINMDALLIKTPGQRWRLSRRSLAATAASPFTGTLARMRCCVPKNFP